MGVVEVEVGTQKREGEYSKVLLVAWRMNGKDLCSKYLPRTYIYIYIYFSLFSASGA